MSDDLNRTPSHLPLGESDSTTPADKRRRRRRKADEIDDAGPTHTDQPSSHPGTSSEHPHKPARASTAQTKPAQSESAGTMPEGSAEAEQADEDSATAADSTDEAGRRRRRRGGRRHRRRTDDAATDSTENQPNPASAGLPPAADAPAARQAGLPVRTRSDGTAGRTERGSRERTGRRDRDARDRDARGRDAGASIGRDRDTGRRGRDRDRDRRDRGPGPDRVPAVITGHTSGWHSDNASSLDEVLLTDKTDQEFWGTDHASAQADVEEANATWQRLNEEVVDVEADPAEIDDADDPQNDATLGKRSADPSDDDAQDAVVDAAVDAEGELIRAPAPLHEEIGLEDQGEEEEEQVEANKVMLVNVAENDECRIAILDSENRLDELYTERISTVSHVGNIYKGIVTNVESAIQAAFVDIGLEKSGFLHISDLQPQYFMKNRQGKPMHEDVGRKLARRDRPAIQNCLRRGQEVIVQIIKEGIGNKGPTLTSYVSVPGRYLVLMPGMTRLGVSRKIMDEDDRRQARRKLEQLSPPADLGFIIRTQGVGRSVAELQRDLDYLMRLWDLIGQRVQHERAPCELFRESDLVIRTLRDIYSRAIARIVVDNEDVAARAREFLGIVDPQAAMAVEYYRERSPVFHRFGVEQEIARIHDKHVPLPSGGSLVIEATEALVAIDVNSGKSRQQSDAEETAFRTNKEAAVEIARQLRLRDLGGVIVCDFIDMRAERHRLQIERILYEAMRHDRARAKILPISRFGIIEMTRQRMRASLKKTIYMDCPHCRGSGVVKRPESMRLDVLRHLRQVLLFPQIASVRVTLHIDVAHALLNQKRKVLLRLELESQKGIEILGKTDVALDHVEFSYTDTVGKQHPFELDFVFARSFRGPVRTTPVGPIGIPLQKSTIHGPRIVGFESPAREQHDPLNGEADFEDTYQPLGSIDGAVPLDDDPATDDALDTESDDPDDTANAAHKPADDLDDTDNDEDNDEADETDAEPADAIPASDEPAPEPGAHVEDQQQPAR